MNKKNERTLTNLANHYTGRIFLNTDSKEDYKILLKNARAEGFYVPPAYDENWDIVALDAENLRLTWGGIYFHMAYRYSENAVKINYSNYINGDDFFVIIMGKMKI